MRVENNRCLVLNADYTPLSIITWQKALVWHMKYENDTRFGIEVVDFYKDDFIQGANNRKFPIPAVVRTQRYFKHGKPLVNFSRKNIFLRDDYTCQYCGTQLESGQLTYDHVIPRSAWKSNSGSPTCWTNIVTACVRCNSRKANRTPQQAGMTLLKLPIRPTKTAMYLPVAHHLRKIRGKVPPEWAIYLPESYR